MTATNVDLRSDTVTRPTPQMREAMAQAAVGDDVFGDDPTVNALEAAVAARMGKEAGLFLSSGTQSNLCAVLIHCARGEEILVGERYHIAKYEAGGFSVLGGVVGQPLPTLSNGALDAEIVSAAIKPDDSHYPMTRLLCLENTTHGEALPLAALEAPAQAARAAGLSVHLDGARIFNAAAALGVDAMRIAEVADSVSVCLSKGLGAPLGTVLCADAAFIARARRLRKMLGGGMRQVGVVAAAGLHALERHVDRLAEDHARARRIEEGLAGLPGVDVLPQERPTNMAFLSFDPARAEALRRRLAEQGVVVSGGAGRLRLVTHLDVDDSGVERVVEAVRDFFGAQAA